MYRAVGLAVAVIGLTACGPTFEAEYHATLKELEQVKLQLAEAQNKLSAADHETRNRIFTLARRANTHLLASSLDTSLISNIQQEMSLLSESYAQLNKNQDITLLTALFYADKLSQILTLNKLRSTAYDRQYTACLSDLDSQGKKNELSTMLCEVQADAAARKPRQQYLANLNAIQQLGIKLLENRREDTQINQQQIENLYNTELANLPQQGAN
tara:strand:+ start:106 stop:747 length:642 start_codon:yes stop_codon:yes gene_type:complete